MSIKALRRQQHTHSFGDDLESFIYIILYASLQWLPVKLSIRLEFWLTQFFSHNPVGLDGGRDAKHANAIEHSYTSELEGEQIVQ